jgi:ferritin-like metal-binding protein YciE
MPNDTDDKLIHYLSDIYSIEQQALAQLRTAPDVAGEPTFARHLRDHLAETERHAELVGGRLEARGGSPSKVKDAVMQLGGKSFLLFARVQPDTPGKLMAHAHSYEAFEWAAYEMLIRVAERAGDAETARVARTIRDEERAMMERLEATFDAAADASIAGKEPERLPHTVSTYLADAHALEEQSRKLLEKAPKIAGDETLTNLYADHLAETVDHARWIEERLAARDESPSKLKDAALEAAALNWGLFFQALSDTPAKLAVFAYAFENLEIAGHELLRRVAAQAGDTATVDTAGRILVQERAMADRLAASFDRALDAAGVAVG